MKEESPKIELNRKIVLLEIKRERELAALKNQIYTTRESLKPINLLKGTFRSLVPSPDLKSDVLDITLSLLTGYLSKKAVLGSVQTPLKSFFGTLFQIGITSIVSKNITELKSEFLGLINKFTKK